MRLFDVQYDTTLFVDTPTWDDLEFSQTQREAANAKLASSALRPPHVLAIQAVGAHADDADDNEEDDGHKVFVSVTLRLQAENEAAAERLAPPDELLAKLMARLFQDAHVDSGLAFEQPWEVLDIQAAE